MNNTLKRNSTSMTTAVMDSMMPLDVGFSSQV